MTVDRGNLFDALPSGRPPAEQFGELWQTDRVTVERIVSWGHATAAGDWFDQETDEWVMVVQGAARLRVDGGDAIEMRAGDWVLLPARVRHRVEWTDPAGPTVWLAVHVRAG